VWASCHRLFLTHIAWNGGLNGDAGIYSLFMIVVVLVILFLPSDWRL
jgi:hypothetical protein